MNLRRALLVEARDFSPGKRSDTMGRALALACSMALPTQDLRTFFVTSVTFNRRAVFQTIRMSELLVEIFNDNRQKGRFLLHEYVIMPDHFHLLLTPAPDAPLEKALQYIKGGFSFRARKILESTSEIWQQGFTNHRVRDSDDYQKHRAYIHQNPVSRFLARTPEEFRFSSAHPDAQLDPAPPWLKPF